MSHAAARLQWEATNRSWLQVQKLNPPPPVQLSLVWPLLYKFRDCTRLAQPPLPVPSQRTKQNQASFPGSSPSAVKPPVPGRKGCQKSHGSLFTDCSLRTYFGGMGMEELYRTLGSRASPASLSPITLLDHGFRAGFLSGTLMES